MLTTGFLLIFGRFIFNCLLSSINSIFFPFTAESTTLTISFMLCGPIKERLLTGSSSLTWGRHPVIINFLCGYFFAKFLITLYIFVWVLLFTIQVLTIMTS